MCTDDIFHEESRSRREKGLSRRDFNLFALSAAAVAMLPGSAVATDIRKKMVEIKTPDGIADCYFAHPGKGQHPGVLLWPDFFSLRPAYQQLADQLARSGYSVLVVNQYYRQKQSPVVPKIDFDDQASRKTLSELAGALTDAGIRSDAKALIAFLDRQENVDRKRKIGTMGYCMGGGFTLLTASAVPERVGAIASFHGGGLATDQADSPHRLIAGIKAHALIAIAENDDKREPDAKDILRDAFAKAGLPAEIEVYAGAEHGWCTPDMTAYYNELQAQRAWGRLLALFGRALA